jgi:hypothetical protein
VGTDDATGGRLAPETDHPPSLAERSLRRHTPKVGAVCGKAARTILCGGLAARAQQAAMPVLGFLGSASQPLAMHTPTSEVAPSVPIAAGPWKLLRPRKLIVLEPGLSRV